MKWVVIALPLWMTTTCFWLVGTDLIILSKVLFDIYARSTKITWTFINSDSYIYTIDDNKWDIAPATNGYYNYVSGICGVVKTSDGKMHLILNMSSN